MAHLLWYEAQYLTKQDNIVIMHLSVIAIYKHVILNNKFDTYSNVIYVSFSN